MATSTPAVKSNGHAGKPMTPVRASGQQLVSIPPVSRKGDSEPTSKEILDGLRFCHQRENAATHKTLEVSAFSYALIELLIEKGLLSEDELNKRKRQVAERLIEKLKDGGTGVMMQSPELDKYEFEAAEPIDCDSRVHLCKAACCRLRFALSKQDLEEGIVRWDLGRPYLIARGKDGYCRHLDREGCGCSVYEHRPVPCRAYNCRSDKRIWADFENRVVSPQLDKLLEQ